MSPTKITNEEISVLIRNLKKIFHTTRLVDVTVCEQYAVNDEGAICKQTGKCYQVWNKYSRCENCISSKAFQSKSTLTKFEFIDDNAFFVITTYIEVDDRPYMLEMVYELTDKMLFGAYGKSEFVEAITAFTKKMYVDALTGAYNRNYYEEQIAHMEKFQAFAMIDADNFKQVNDTFGHQTGDLALQIIARTIRSQVRDSDELIRYGGDEFILVFQGIPAAKFEERLNRICTAVREQRIEQQPDLHLSVSIGGYYHPDAIGDGLVEADAMLYEAKKTKNCVKIKGV